MANIQPSSPATFDDVYQIETTDWVLGGAGQTANRQAMNLVNRTQFLKDKIDDMPEASQILKNKTIDEKDNTILSTPRTVSTSQTLDFGKQESILIDTSGITITLGSVPFEAYRLPIFNNSNGEVYIKFININWGYSVVVIVPGQQITFKHLPGRWSVENGTTFFTGDSTPATIDNIKVNDWQAPAGFGVYSFQYLKGGATSEYNVPTNNCCVTVDYSQPNVANAIASDGKYQWQQFYLNAWTNIWNRFTADDGTAIFTNKTIDGKDNTILNTPVTYTDTTSVIGVSPTKEQHVVLGEGVAISLGTAPYVGYELRVGTVDNLAWNRNAYILYNAGLGVRCVAISYEQELVFYYRGNGYWVMQNGTMLRTLDWTVENAPIKDSTLDPSDPGYRYLPNDWKETYGIGIGTWNYMYNVAYGNTKYDLPVQRCSLSVMESHGTDAVAVVRHIDSTGGGKTWVRERYQNATWQSAWTLYSADEESATLKNKTIDAYDNTIKCTPVPAVNGTTYNFTKETSIVDESGVTIALGSAPYAGFKVNIFCRAGATTIKYSNIAGAIVVVRINAGSGITFINNFPPGNWNIESAPVLFVSAVSYVDSILVNDWRQFYADCPLTFQYRYNGVSDYGIPESNCSVSVSSRSYERTAVATKLRDSSLIWVNDYNNDNHSWNNWTKFSSDNNSVTDKNITNCITEIPQNINLTLSSGTLTLKAGSKVYVPNGFEADGTTPKFDVVVTTQDKTASQTLINGVFGITYYTGDQQINGAYAWSNYYSGPTAPSVSGNSIWYDTTNNLCKYSNDLGVTWTPGISLPLGIITANSTIGFIELNNIFNGMGYIGSTLFVLPGVKAVVPNGRNTDGTLKNYYPVITQVKTTENTYSGTRILTLDGVGQFSALGDSWYYDENKNIYTNGSTNISITPIAVFTFANNNVSDFKPKTTFHAVDYNDPTVEMVVTFSDNTTATYNVRIKE